MVEIGVALNFSNNLFYVILWSSVEQKEKKQAIGLEREMWITLEKLSSRETKNEKRNSHWHCIESNEIRRNAFSRY